MHRVWIKRIKIIRQPLVYVDYTYYALQKYLHRNVNPKNYIKLLLEG